MMIQRIRWQALISICGIGLMLTMLGYLSGGIEMVMVPERGGSYVEAVPARPVNLNPLYLQSRADRDLAGLLFNSLLRPDETGLLVPDLARKWEVSEDGKRYTFELRKDVVWHDGAPFSASDVAYTISVLQDPSFTADPALAELWRAVVVEMPTPYRVEVTLPDSLAPFAPFPSFATFPILPHHLLQGIPVSQLPEAPYSRRPVGTGPWKIQRLEGDEIVLAPHPHSPSKEMPVVDQLILRFYDDAEATLQAFRNGEAMGIAQVPPEFVASVLNDSSLNPYFTPFSGYSAIFMNLKRPGLDTPQVREALMFGLDRQSLIDTVLAGQGIVADTFLMPTHWAYATDVPRYVHDAERAASLLEEAGWVDSDENGVRDRDGVPLQFTLLVDGSNSTLVAVAEEVARQWQEIGVEVQPGIVSPVALTQDALRPREFDMVLLSTPPQGMPADPDFYPLWHSSQASGDGENYTSFTSEEADRLLVEARRTLDLESRRAAYTAFQNILATELPALPLYHPIYTYAVSNLVREVQVGPMASPTDRFDSLPEWTIRTRRILLDRDEPVPTMVP